MRQDVAVIGGGIAGLATGALLAKRGYRAVVLEKGNQPGGRATPTSTRCCAQLRPARGAGRNRAARKLMGRSIGPCRVLLPDPMRGGPTASLARSARKPHQMLGSRLPPLGSKLRLGR
jgi:phytoene dehydrogenase-like protein